MAEKQKKNKKEVKVKCPSCEYIFTCSGDLYLDEEVKCSRCSWKPTNYGEVLASRLAVAKLLS